MRPLYILILLSISSFITAQNELPTGQIEVVKDFEVRLVETKKIRIIPQPLALDTTVRQYQYRLLVPSPSIEYVVPELKPLAINPEQKPAYYPLFAKAGYGSPNSLLGQFSYDHSQNEIFDWGIDFRHLSANSKKIDLQKFSDSRGRINGSYLLNETMQVEGNIEGHFEKVYFYGAEEIPTNPDALARSFKRYDAHFTISNAISESPTFRYAGLFQYLFDKDDLGSRENTLRIGGEIQTLVSEHEFPVGINLIADLTSLKEVTTNTLQNFLIEPFFKFNAGEFKIHLGALALLKEEANEILPQIEITYNLFPLVSLRAGWVGEVFKNNFHHLSLYNPYLVTRLDSITNMVSREIYGGVTGTTGIFNYEVTGSYTSFERMAFFLQDPDQHEQFLPIYDDGTYIGIKGALSFDILKHVTLRGTAWQRFYSLDNEEKPWHKPSIGIDAQASYNGGEDVYHVSLIFHGENGLPYITPGGTESRLDPLLDLNLHGDYFITPSIGGFLELNNILSNNRERWASYPSYGFNAKAGIMVRM